MTYSTQTEQREGPYYEASSASYSIMSCSAMAALDAASMEVDDDSSVSSTIAVACFSQEKLQHPSSQLINNTSQSSQLSSNTKKRVRFSALDNKFHDNTVIDKEDCKDLWYQAPDYKHFKGATKYLAREIAQSEPLNRSSSPYSYHRVLKRTYKACVTYDPFDETASAICSVLTATEEKRLSDWMQVSTSRLGLERMAIRELAVDRSMRRQEMVETVLEMQEEAMEERHLSGCDFDADAQAEMMRQACEEISRPSRLFAQCLAQGQAATPKVSSQRIVECLC
jgi:hypothetical protein